MCTHTHTHKCSKAMCFIVFVVSVRLGVESFDKKIAMFISVSAARGVGGRQSRRPGEGTGEIGENETEKKEEKKNRRKKSKSANEPNDDDTVRRRVARLCMDLVGGGIAMAGGGGVA